MKFYVYNKPNGVKSVEAEKIEEVALEGTPFMVVAAGKVADGEIYQAIQIKPNVVQINYKRGHRFVTANTIAEALGSSTVVDEPIKYVVIFETDHGSAPDPIEVERGSTITLPVLDDVVSEDAEYKFAGWLGKGVKDNRITPTKDVTLKANWEMEITHDGNSSVVDEE